MGQLEVGIGDERSTHHLGEDILRSGGTSYDDAINVGYISSFSQDRWRTAGHNVVSKFKNLDTHRNSQGLGILPS